MFTTEEAFIAKGYEIISMSFDVEIEDYEEMKPIISQYTEESFATFTISDYKKIVQLYCSSEELDQYAEITDEAYTKLANDKKYILNGKILWGYIDICRSECNTFNEEPVDIDENGELL